MTSICKTLTYKLVMVKKSERIFWIGVAVMQRRAWQGSDSRAVKVWDPAVFFNRWPSSTTSKCTFWTSLNTSEFKRKRSYEMMRISDWLLVDQARIFWSPSWPPFFITTRFGWLAFPSHLSNSFAQFATSDDGHTTTNLYRNRERKRKIHKS